MNRDIRQLLVDYLQQSGYTTVAVDNGNDALSQARTEQPDLVLLDVMMPGLDGFRSLPAIARSVACTT